MCVPDKNNIDSLTNFCDCDLLILCLLLIIASLLILHETYDHWSVAVLTVTVHYSFFPTFDFIKNMLLSALDSIC